MGKKGEMTTVETRVLSVRAPFEEAERIDADAKAAGMNRNDFMLMKIREHSSFANAEEINQLIDVLRQLTIMFDTYLGILDRLVRHLEGPGGRAEGGALEAVLGEIDRAQDMMKLSLKAQRQAVRVLRAMHDDVKR